MRLLGFWTLACACASFVGAAEKLQFNRDIRPILSDKCFSCHGPDSHGRKAKLRLDLRDAALNDHDGVRAIVPGDPGASEGLIRMLSKDPDELMPPPEAEKSMTAEEIATIRQWIAEGAEYQDHWAYTQPKRPAPPAVVDAKWGRSPIDQFVYQRLRKEGVAPAPLTDARTLVRRLHLDLTGLPPRPEVVDAFVADPSQDRWNGLVDALLKSPHYGERMASYWLDLVRFADTQGYHSDDKQNIFPYRDYVIRAFYQNKPFDDFTIEQLAGDLLPNATEEQKVASGYNRLNQVTGEGGAQAAEYLVKYASDRIGTTSEVWMGATLGCAECHDHKYDPFSQKDFYQFGAFFADLQQVGVYSGKARSTGDYPPMMTLTKPADGAKQKSLGAALADFEKQRAKLLAQAKKPAPGKTAPGAWQTPPVHAAKSSGLSALIAQVDGTVLATGKKSKNENYHVICDAVGTTVGALRLTILGHSSFKGLSRGNGNVVLSGVELYAVAADAEAKRRRLPFVVAEAGVTNSQNWLPAGMIDKNPKSGWAGYADKSGAQTPQVLVFRLAKPESIGRNERLEVVLKHEADRDFHTTGRFQVSISEDTRAPLKAGAPVQDPAVVAVDKKIADTQKQLSALKKSGPKTMVSVATKPMVTRVLPRGDWLNKTGEIVEPAVPHFLPQPAVTDRRLTRLDLAKWLVDDANPLTARVTVNRLWYLFFGHGISNVLNDLGSQGEWPVHPELLDWLAVEFRESGWDVQHMIRLMVNSRTYRLSSVPSAKQVDADPLNRLHARQARVRLQAEFVRDNALAVSGLLERKIGGDSVYPYQPKGYWSDSYKSVGRPHVYKQSSGESLYRRGLYTFWKRSFLHPSLLAFDAPNRESCEARRPVSNTPLQALVLLNDPTYVESARALAARALTDRGLDDRERLHWVMRQTLARKASSDELSVMSTLLQEQRARYKDAPEAAKAVISVGASSASGDLPPSELAAWTAVTRTVLNLHEVITRD